MPIGQLPAQATDFTLDHVLGHPVTLSSFRGQPMVLMFGGKDSADQLKNNVLAIRRGLGANQVQIVSVSDLRAAPRPVRIIVKKQMKKAYEDAVSEQRAALEAAGKPLPADPSTVIVMLMDWSGGVIDSFGLSGVDHEAVGLVLDADQNIIGSGSGDGIADEVLGVLSSR
jgi:cytochrome oxidase Cu insertion factor (SCO1/SenC/PrrC family)